MDTHTHLRRRAEEPTPGALDDVPKNLHQEHLTHSVLELNMLISAISTNETWKTNLVADVANDELRYSWTSMK